MLIFYNKWKKYNEIQLTKNKMDLNPGHIETPYQPYLLNKCHINKVFSHFHEIWIVPAMNILAPHQEIVKGCGFCSLKIIHILY